MELTKSQQEVLKAFREFLAGDDQVFILKGAAGTGKTTLLREFIECLNAAHRHNAGARSYCLMAPTGRAAYIIGSKTGVSASTIHRGIYGLKKLNSIGRSNDEEDNEGLHFQFGLRTNDDPSYTVYIIDEASMISDLFSENEAFSFGSGCVLTDLFDYVKGRKVVLIGDYAQLHPIGMNFSPALDGEYIRNKFSCRVREVLLREVLRQSGDGVMLKNATAIRDSIENQKYIEFKIENGDDCESADTDLLQPYWHLSPEKPSVKSAIITHSNQHALDYNLAIRRHYYGEHAPRLIAKDLLMISRNNYAFEFELFNGNIVQVEACQPDNEVIERHIKVKVGRDREELVILRFRKATIRFGLNGNPVSLNVMLLDNFLDDPNGALGGVTARALIAYFHTRLPERLKSQLSNIRRWMRSKSSLSTEERELCDTYTKLLQTDPYYNAVICKYGYAMTCHKAQGGEWDNVFVDMRRHGGTSNEDYFRWAYTAITRASKRIWHYRSPDFNYISGLVVEEIKPSANIKISVYSSGSDFCKDRMERIALLSEENNLRVSEDRGKDFQHIINFTDGIKESATFQLWYNKKGYSGKETILASTSDDFSALCKGIIDSSLAPEEVPFEVEDRPFALKLVEYMKQQIEKTGIRLLDITQEQYQDVFHLKTDGYAKIFMKYTGRGNYTYMTFVSSLGQDDQKLQALRQDFI